MVVQIYSSALLGIKAQKVTIEVHCSLGVGYHLVGMADHAVRESTYRIAGALQSVGHKIPGKKFIINMAPADLRKSGAHYDLALAVGILLASNQLTTSVDLNKCLLLGELALDGTLRPLKGVLPIVLAAKEHGFSAIILPEENAAEATIVQGVNIYGMHHLSQVMNFIQGKNTGSSEKITAQKDQCQQCRVVRPNNEYDFSMVRGQETVKRALEIAASGGHNVLMLGPPGSGKTLLARCLPSILPPLSYQEALQTTTIYSVMGQDLSSGLLYKRPFRSPHHSISDKALIGGGRYPMPGEISMAHNGVLFLDELPEFTRKTLEALRQPLEEGKVHLSRAQYSVTYPSVVMLVCSMNPSAEGSGDISASYLKKISGPLLDRIDLHVEVPGVSFEKLSETSSSESSALIGRRVLATRQRQIKRLNETSLTCNAHMSGKDIEAYCTLKKPVLNLLEQAMNQLGLSARAYHRIIKVARTIADMDQSQDIRAEHMAEAAQYRVLDRQLDKGIIRI